MIADLLGHASERIASLQSCSELFSKISPGWARSRSGKLGGAGPRPLNRPGPWVLWWFKTAGRLTMRESCLSRLFWSLEQGNLNSKTRILKRHRWARGYFHSKRGLTLLDKASYLVGQIGSRAVIAKAHLRVGFALAWSLLSELGLVACSTLGPDYTRLGNYLSL